MELHVLGENQLYKHHQYVRSTSFCFSFHSIARSFGHFVKKKKLNFFFQQEKFPDYFKDLEKENLNSRISRCTCDQTLRILDRNIPNRRTMLFIKIEQTLSSFVRPHLHALITNSKRRFHFK